jgi:UDP-2,4-diacetamido-2,4,6-trideoxy-beta-L-altropyranose hydrolase
MPVNQIAFRTDATSQIGTGHFMRCLTLADVLKSQGAYIRFVSRNLPAHLGAMLSAKGMDLVALSNEIVDETGGDLAHSQWLGASQIQDARVTVRALSDSQWDWIVVDHYALDARWESVVRGCTKQILVIDDIADRNHDCDMLLDQNFYSDMQSRYDGKLPAHCVKLLGPRYALLRDEFRQLRAQVKPRTGAVRKILVFFGGVDADNFTGLALEALATLENKAIKIDVVIGAQHPCHAQIQQTCDAQGYECHVQTSRMAELMAEADLAIGAGGSATWERCCLGLPAMSLCVAENQQKQIADAAEVGLLYAISSEDSVSDSIRRHTKTLLETPALLKLISRSEMKLVDGKGVTRVVSAMGVSGVEIRHANEQDSKNLFNWRNHQAIRAVSRNNAPIAWEDHQRWFAAVMANPDRELLIGTIDDQPMGVVRFDKEGVVAEISIYLVPEGGFTGQGRNVLLAAERWLKNNRSDIKIIRAGVLGENEVSKKLFLGANYRVVLLDYQKEI